MLLELGQATGNREIASGFMGGILVGGGMLLFVFSGTPFLADAAFIVMGAMCIFDASFPFGRQPHMVSLLGGFIAGIIAAGVSVAFSLAYILCAATLIAFLVSLLLRKRKSAGSSKKGF